MVTRNATAVLLVGAILCAGMVSAAHGIPSHVMAAEIELGFRTSIACIRGGVSPTKWCDDFQAGIRQRRQFAQNEDPFLLGANLGFSLRSEHAAEAAATSPGELRKLAVCGTLARLEFERIKTRLALTDSEVIRILKIQPREFIAWKARAWTQDSDRSVVGAERGIGL